MFRIDLLSINRSLDAAFKASGICHTGCCEYSIKTPHDGKDFYYPKHVELYTKI
jgi:hypothetical protein